jgi:hypothetical protein
VNPITGTGKTVTIKPDAPLEADRTYHLMLEITSGFDTLFDRSSLSGYNGTKLAVGSSNAGTGTIVFKTVKEDKLKLASTNIYKAHTDSGGLVANINGSTDGWFPAAGAIELTFTRAIPAGSTVKAALSRGSLTGPVTQSQSISLTVNSSVTKVTIKPDLPLQEDTQYYLLLEIKNGTQPLFSQSDLNAYSSPNSLLNMSKNHLQLKKNMLY